MSHEIIQWSEDWADPKRGVLGKTFMARCDECGAEAELKVSATEMILSKIDIKKYVEQQLAEQISKACANVHHLDS